MKKERSLGWTHPEPKRDQIRAMKSAEVPKNVLKKMEDVRRPEQNYAHKSAAIELGQIILENILDDYLFHDQASAKNAIRF